MDSSNAPFRCDALMFFGSTGDLAYKQIFPALQALVRRGRLDMPIVAIGRKEVALEKLRARVRESLEAAGGVDDAAFATLSERLRYVAVDYDKPESFRAIRDAIGEAKHPLHYVALPPEVFEKVARNLAEVGLARGARLALEKPFGTNLASAQALSKAIAPAFPEEALFRMDHFLGKEPVENLIYFRAANPLIETSLSADYVESVQITMAEKFGVKGRAKFYDSVGAIRDVVQNHLLQVLACLTMDLPTTRGRAAIRDARSRILADVRPLVPEDVVRGQAHGFKDEEGVNPKSTTETFAALRFFIDSPRWKGVPFYVRAGKSLPVTVTEAIVEWKRSRCPVLEDHAAAAPNTMRFRLGPEAVLALGTNVKKDGEAMAGESKELSLVRRTTPDTMKPYERLLGDALEGDLTLFARRDAVEESWRVITPILNDATPVHGYAPGTWGPSQADAIAPRHGWINPSE